MKGQYGMKRRVGLIAALVGAAAMALFTTGCERPDWENPEYVEKMLVEGNDRERHQAVEALRNIPEESRADVTPAAADLYLEEENFRSDIMQRLITWRDIGAKDAYLEELAEDHTGYGKAAGETLGRIGAEDAIPKMIEIFDETSDNDRRIGILQGLSQMPDAAAVDKAVEVLDLDVDNYPIDLHRAACEFIGGLAAEDPEAISDEVLSRLAYARFLADDRGRDVAGDCGLAIQQVGHAMVPELKKLFNEENEDVERLLMTYDNPSKDEYFPPNKAKQRAAEHLASMRAPDAVEMFVEDLEATVEAPDMDGDQLSNWRATEAATINEMLRGLGDTGDPEAREILERIVKGELFSEEWGEITDGNVAFQMLQDSARALARLGDRDARPTLMEMTGADIVPSMAARFAAIEEAAEERDDVDPVPLTEQLRPQWLAAQSFVYLAESDDREEYESLVDEIEDEELKEKLESFMAGFDVMDECQDVEDEAERAECFGGFLDAEEEHARVKAVMELSRLPTEAAAPVVADAIDTSDLELRQHLSFAGYRVPSPELAANIEEVLDDESSRSGDDYARDHRRLEMLHAWLQHYDEEPADGQ